jgi:hypothetical protein
LLEEASNHVLYIKGSIDQPCGWKYDGGQAWKNYSYTIKVKLIDNGFCLRFRYNIIWDGKNNSAQYLCSGVYFIHIRAEDFINSKKILILR